jgi:acyl dehydratase
MKTLSADIVGTRAGPLEQLVDARWIMAYNAGLGETQARYYDTGAKGGPAVHPLFPVCYEWPASNAIRDLAALKPIAGLLVHAQHDLTIHRRVRVDETVRTSARIAAAEPRSPGAFVVYRFETTGAGGEPISTTDFGTLYRGVRLDRAAGEAVNDPSPLTASLEPAGQIEVSAIAAHLYTECARIWNPIHTDVAYARGAGLPDIILHGTATLAYSISAALRKFNVQDSAVRRVVCRFAGMVLMPSTLRLHATRQGSEVQFETRSERDEPVISRGRLLLE